MAKSAVAQAVALVLRSDGLRYSKAPITPPTLAPTANSANQVTVVASGSSSGLGSIVSYRWRRDGVLLNGGVPSASPLVDVGLLPGTLYSYTATALDSAGNESGFSASAPVTTQAGADTTAPTTPGSFNASVINSTTVRLAWLASSDSGGSGLSGYRVERSLNGATGWVQVYQGALLTADDNTLAPATKYYWRARSYDGAGNNSQYTSVISATTASGTGAVPGVPTNLRATALSPYTVRYECDPVPGANWYAFFTDDPYPAGYSRVPILDMRGTFGYLNPSTTYSNYTVRAVNDYGDSAPATFSPVTTMPLGLGPSSGPNVKPWIMVVPIVGRTMIKVAVICAGDDQDRIAEWRYEFSPVGANSWTEFGVENGPAVNDPHVGNGNERHRGSTHCHTGLTPGQNFDYRVRYKNSGGFFSPYSNVVTGSTAPVGAQLDPNPPATFTTGYPAAAPLRTVNCSTPAQLTAALAGARDGDKIVLDKAGSWGNSTTYVIPNRGNGTVWATIETNGLASLPPVSTGVTPADAANMPFITGPGSNQVLFKFALGAHHWHLDGLHLEFNNTLPQFFFVDVGLTDAIYGTKSSEICHHINIHRCYISSPTVGQTMHAVSVLCDYFSMRGCYFTGIRGVGSDSQCVYNNGGQFLQYLDNFFESTGENIIFGGGYPVVRHYRCQDIEVRRNTFGVNPAWQIQDPTYGTSYNVKNLLEFKNGIRAVVTDNKFRNLYANAQTGYCFLITPKNELTGDNSLWNDCSDFYVARNIVENCCNSFNLAREDYPTASGFTPVVSRVLCEHNLLTVTGEYLPSSGLGLTALSSQSMLLSCNQGVVRHNTFIHTRPARIPSNTSRANCMILLSIPQTGQKFDDIRIYDNLGEGGYAINGSGIGKALLNTGLDGGIIDHCAIFDTAWVGVSGSDFAAPCTNISLPAAYADIGFVGGSAWADYAGKAAYALRSDSPFHNAASDGTDMGCNIGLLP